MRDSGSAARASSLPPFAATIYSTFSESRFSSLCVSHGSDLGEWSSAEQQEEATDLPECLRCGQESMPISRANTRIPTHNIQTDRVSR
ncbi:unnamed protein product [Pleuronectes platessa]|uniref:Uncharacterized protein n=1 Tax=Pleuronectes platessa TaxID=8262 RepID=A0A9N7V9F3_PLEPL|nr:unnamed protein product [Pleuronectes platessa]